MKKEYARDESIRGITVQNLTREFELLRMKESKTVKDYFDRLLDIVNKIRLLGTEKIQELLKKFLLQCRKDMKDV